GLTVAPASRGGAATFPRSKPAPPTPIATLVQRAKSENGLVIYGNAPTPFLQPVIDAFGKQYPGIKVQDTDLSDQQVFSKYESEAAQGARTADLLIASAPAV